MSIYFILKDHEPVAVDPITWGFWFEQHQKDRIVAQEVVGRFWVSTVFIGLDHDFSGARLVEEYGGGIPIGFYRPLLWETIVFNNEVSKLTSGSGEELEYQKSAGYQRRYRSWHDAEKGHQRAVKYYTRYERMLVHRENVLRKLL